MTVTQLREWWHRTPFLPFNIIAPGRDPVHVPHPDFLTISPKGRIAEVWLKDERQVRLDVMLITALEESARNSKRASSRRRRKRNGS
ncbi:MAG TPA: hypothetical protein VG095_04765 [Chthoniobacterales bacterium]|nr:hypothetical protein [Chthoniobacterales bacterium]